MLQKASKAMFFSREETSTTSVSSTSSVLSLFSDSNHYVPLGEEEKRV